MKIGILGAGNVGGTLGLGWAKSGHEIFFGVRDTQSDKVKALLDEIGANAQAGSLAEAVAFGEVVLLAVPWTAVQEAIRQAGDFTGKILLDATNRLVEPAPDSAPSAVEDISRWASGARVVKAFNTTGSGNMSNPKFGAHCADMYICGDDPDAKSAAAELAQDVGFEVVDAGPLANAVLLEALAKLWIQLAYPLGMGPDIAFKLLERS